MFYRVYSIILLFICCIGVMPSYAQQNDTYSFVVGLEEGWAGEDGTGIASETFQLIQQALPEASMQLTALPYGRAIHQLKRRQAHCILGGDLSVADFYFDSEMVASPPFYVTQIHAYTLTSQPIINTKAELKGKTVGILLGLEKKQLGINSLDNHTIEQVRTIDSLYTMLKSNRIDAIINPTPTLHTERYDLHYNPQLSLNQFTESVLCRESEESSLLIEQINQVLPDILEGEDYQKILNRYH